MNASAPMRFLDWRQPDLALALAVDGYQFPGNTSGHYDNEWLMISGRVRCADGEWTFRDPCYVSSELLGLASRLEGGYIPDSPGGDFTIEPVLQFDWMAAGQVRVSFRLEAEPPWGPSGRSQSAADGWGFPLVFDVSTDLAARTATTLREAAARLPPQ